MLKKHKRHMGKFTLLNASGKLIVYLYALILIVPMSFAVMTAFKTGTERVMNPIGLPKSFLNFSNFAKAWTDGGLVTATKNSIIISVSCLVLNLIQIVFVTFHLDEIRDTRIGKFIYMVILASIFIPGVSSVTSLMLRRRLGMYNNLWGEIVANSTLNAVGVFIVGGFIRTVPRELREAAEIDGASDFYYMTHVLVHVVRPAIVTIGIQIFQGLWNNCLGMMLTLRSKKLWTIPIALTMNFTTQYSVQYEVMFAGIIMTSIPLVVAYCKCQKYFVSALTGSIKG